MAGVARRYQRNCSMSDRTLLPCRASGRCCSFLVDFTESWWLTWVSPLRVAPSQAATLPDA
jgi:hypothetical protein